MLVPIILFCYFFFFFKFYIYWQILLGGYICGFSFQLITCKKKKKLEQNRRFKTLTIRESQGRSEHLSQRKAYPHLPSHYTDNCSLSKCWSILSAYDPFAAHACIRGRSQRNSVSLCNRCNIWQNQIKPPWHFDAGEVLSLIKGGKLAMVRPGVKSKRCKAVKAADLTL